MDAGIIASRYATALLKYVLETGAADRVYAEVGRLSAALDRVPELRSLLDDPEGVSTEAKMKVFRTALDGDAMSEELDRFLRLVISKDRISLIRLMLHDFEEKYRRHLGLVDVTMVSAVPLSEATIDAFKAKIKAQTGLTALITTRTDPALIGGFVLEIGDKMLDTSVKRQLDNIRRSFIDNNRRIV